MQTAQPKVLVALATYNERHNLAGLVEHIRATAPSAHVLILDDHSPDGTGELADELAARDPQIQVIHRGGKLGLGTAILAIMQHAIARNFDLLVTMDADFSHDPCYLPALLDGMREADVMIGSRYVPGGGVENWPLSRRMISASINLLMRGLLRLGVRDMSGGYRCYRVALLKHANFERLLSHGYSFQQEALHRCVLAGARVGETPIVFVDRRVGQSKANLKEIVNSFSTLLRLGWHANLHRASMLPRASTAAPVQKAA